MNTAPPAPSEEAHDPAMADGENRHDDSIVQQLDALEGVQ